MSPRKAKSVAEKISAIGDLMGDLENRPSRRSGTARRGPSGASGDVGDFVSEAIDRIMNRMHSSAAGVTQSFADEATQLGSDAFKKITHEIEHRPLIMLGLAAGVGFLVGMANRR